MATFSGRGTKEAFKFIRRWEDVHPVKSLCRHLGVSRSGYYDWRDRKPSQRAQSDQQLLYAIRRIFQASKERYGSPKVHKALRKEGIRVGEKRVARLMRQSGLKARVERVYRRLYKARNELKIAPNHRLEIGKPNGPDQQWSSDVTYIKFGRRHVFLAVIIDLWSRKLVGWALHEQLNSDLSISALVKALHQRRPKPGLILHTDRGTEYRAKSMQKCLSKYGITHSMNRPGQCTDNAEVESFFKTLKAELIHESFFASVAQLRDKIGYYIKNFYNRVRLHSSLNYVSPIQFERAH